MVSGGFVSLLSTIIASIHVANAVPNLVKARQDPCGAIANQTWVAPADVRACFTSFPADADIKANIVDVISKTMVAFNPSTNFYRQAPPPFDTDVHSDIIGELQRINKTEYANAFELHQDLSLTFKKLKDGHTVYINRCFDSVFLSVLPTPLALLTDETGEQHVHIAPEAFKVAESAFSDELDVWQNALPDNLKGQLESLSGARVLEIDGQDPMVAVNKNAEVVGTYQGLGTRQNLFFANYNAGDSGWQYALGFFAQKPLPLFDSVTLKIQRVGQTVTDTITLPYRSHPGPNAVPWTDSESFWANNCVANANTNGINIYANSSASAKKVAFHSPAFEHRQSPIYKSVSTLKLKVNVLLDTIPQQDIVLPPELTPQSPLEGSLSNLQFYMLEDGKTGAMTLGSFDALEDQDFQETVVKGLQSLKSSGATQLIVDTSGNTGGIICEAHFLHRILSGAKNTTVPNAGLQTFAHAGTLPELITDKIIAGGDPDVQLFYNPLFWEFANNTNMPEDYDWLAQDTLVNRTVNGQPDQFSQTLGDDECEPYQTTIPDEPMFEPGKIAIVGNGQCGSSCALFAVAMAKEEGAKMVVYGGVKNVDQQYCGVVGGQSSDFSTMDTHVKSTSLKDHPLAPPDFTTNSVQGIVWRLGYGIENPDEPEEYQDHSASLNLPLTMKNVNNPMAIWNDVAKAVF